MPSIDGRFLRTQRTLAGWSLKDFADAIDESPQLLADVESGRRSMARSPDFAQRCAKALHLPVTKLYREDG